MVATLARSPPQPPEQRLALEQRPQVGELSRAQTDRGGAVGREAVSDLGNALGPQAGHPDAPRPQLPRQASCQALDRRAERAAALVWAAQASARRSAEGVCPVSLRMTRQRWL
jgi:hypothetical protein